MGSQLIIIVAMLAVMWFLLIRPQRTRQAEQQRMLSNLAVGDEIITAGGVYGHIRQVGEEDLSVEVAPGLTLRVAKRAVAAVVEPETDETDEPEDAGDADELGYDPELDEEPAAREAGAAESQDGGRR